MIALYVAKRELMSSPGLLSHAVVANALRQSSSLYTSSLKAFDTQTVR